MLRFGFVLLINALPLLGMEAMSTRRETTKQLFDSAAEALDACQSWRHREGQFSALIPAAAPVSTQTRLIQTDIRSCEADLDHALVLGRRYSVVAGVHYNKTLRRGGLFIGGWLLTSALAVIRLLTLGHGLLLVDQWVRPPHRSGPDRRRSLDRPRRT